MKIGFIGLGIMGSRMAHNLLKQGAEVIVYNRTKSKADELITAGASWAETPQALAHANLIIAPPTAVQEVAFGDNGFVPHLSDGAVWVDCTTTNPMFVQEIATKTAEYNIGYVDAPVAGTKPHAQNGELTFVMGGDESHIEFARPYLEMMGSRIVHVGEVGKGTALKVVVNNLLATAMATFAESVTLGKALGLPEESQPHL